MPIKPATLAAFKALVVETGKLDVRMKKLDKEVAKRQGRIKEAMDANDTTLLDIQLKAIKGDLSETESLLRDANKQLSPLQDLQNDEDFMRERDDDVARVGGIIAAVRTGTAAHYKTLKNLENKAEEAWRGSVRSEKYAVQQLAGDEQGTEELRKELHEAWTKALKFEEMATKAQDTRNAQGLNNARTAFAKLELGMLKIRVEIQGKVLDKNEKNFGERDISEDTMKTLKDGYRDTRLVYERAQGLLKDLQAIDKRMTAIEIKPIDIKKAREAMGLEAKADAQLTKVFNGPPAGWEKGLDGIGSSFKTGTTGKKYLASLRSAGIVPD